MQANGANPFSQCIANSGGGELVIRSEAEKGSGGLDLVLHDVCSSAMESVSGGKAWKVGVKVLKDLRVLGLCRDGVKKLPLGKKGSRKERQGASLTAGISL